MAVPKIRKYPHFDADLTVDEAETLVNVPDSVARHAFFPLIDYVERWTRFARKGMAGKPKERPIRYASRRDSCIYSHYRGLLSAPYEAELKKLGIDSSVLAYRRIPTDRKRGNKSNIDFANDAFTAISDLGDCYVYALDIKSFFDNIDHAKLKAVWARIIGQTSQLPADHFAVFRSVTRYASVGRGALYKTLGFIGQKKLPGGRTSIGYLVKRVPLQVCNPHTFRSKVKSLISINPSSRGIPQGAPISDVLANMYLLDFDYNLWSEVEACGGRYYRYSDDILIIIPKSAEDIQARLIAIQNSLSQCGDNLEVQQQKTSVFRFQTTKTSEGSTQSCTLVHGTHGKNGLEYLGFRFDGKRVYIRDSTRSALDRKIVSSARKLARLHIDKNPSLTLSQLKSSFNYNLLMTKFGRVKDFESNVKGYSGWTFWTYAVKAQTVFGSKGNAILKQLSRYKKFARNKVDLALEALVAKP